MIACRPRPKWSVFCQITFGVFTVRVTCIVTTAGWRNPKCTVAASRNPSPFGLIVVRSGRSPANGVEPFAIDRSTSFGAFVSSVTTRRASTAER